MIMRMLSIRQILVTSTCMAVLLISLPSAHPLLGAPSVPQQQQRNQHQDQHEHQPLKPVPVLTGDWAGAKAALQSPDCCVVSVSGLESHLCVLQAHLADGGGPAELDLRARVRASSAYGDCLRVRRSVSPAFAGDDNDNSNDNNKKENEVDPCTAALVELARGVASLADGPLEGVCTDAFLRIVSASDYRARDPMYHTDKAPLRGYVTLRGVGTEYITRPCSLIEYMTLRGLGKVPGDPVQNLRRADELEFIVMKGDHYECNEGASATKTKTPSTVAATTWLTSVWKRTKACVHRSPPGSLTGSGHRRVIVSLDLADGDDDREWYQANTKREWRSGMTQRKSRLVA